MDIGIISILAQLRRKMMTSHSKSNREKKL
jgi:hypothetical protein